MLTVCGFEEEKFDSVCISLDKLDKIGAEGVKEELLTKGCSSDAAEKLLSLFKEQVTLERALSFIGDECPEGSRLAGILENSLRLAGSRYNVVFDLTLIRGQGYYTGTVFEIALPGYPGAIAGGGRYDHLVGKFIGEQVPAVGFSIGFERIFGILQEQGGDVMGGARPRLAVIYEGSFADAYEQAEKMRDGYDCTLFTKPKKVGKLLSNLEKSGYSGFVYADNPEDIRLFGAQN